MPDLKIARRLDYVALFILNASEMVLELVASRFLSPYFGNSNFVWTAIIGIILLAGSLGNLLGSKIAGMKSPRFISGSLFLGAAFYLALTPLLGAPILESMAAAVSGSIQLWAVIASVVFFLIPATILGVITPIIMKDWININGDRGGESGRITSIIAIGSLMGVFVGGFWLIPAIGTQLIFVLLAAVVALCAILIRPLKNLKFSRQTVVFGAGLVATLAVAAASVAWIGVGNDTPKQRVSIDTEYGRIIVEDIDDVRYYKQSGAYSSATYLAEDKKYELVYEYAGKYDEAFKFLDVEKAAMIGGAAYQYPKYYISHFLDKSMDVVEIDPVSTEIARRYFFLDDLIEEYGLTENGRLGLYNEDGRVFLAGAGKKYDAVFNDAFAGSIPPATLTTVEAAEVIHDSLADGGVYMSNLLSAVDGPKGKFLRSEVATLKRVFGYVYVVPAVEGTQREKYSNWIVIATDNGSYRPVGEVEVSFGEGDVILTDDYCPIDSLVATDYFDK